MYVRNFAFVSLQMKSTGNMDLNYVYSTLEVGCVGVL